MKREDKLLIIFGIFNTLKFIAFLAFILGVVIFFDSPNFLILLSLLYFFKEEFTYTLERGESDEE